MTNIFQFAEAKINVTNTNLLDELCERLEKANDAVAERLVRNRRQRVKETEKWSDFNVFRQILSTKPKGAGNKTIWF